MTAPGEYKTVQARILKYAQEIGWRYVSRRDAEARRGFDPAGVTPEEKGRKGALFFRDLLYSQVLAFNPKYREAQGAFVGELQRLHADIYGNRDLFQTLHNQSKFFCPEENRELDLIVIDYGDISCSREDRRNVYEVTEEFYFHNGRYGTREDVVFLTNGIPVLVIECKNASKDEAIALGVDQIRRYHVETPEVMVPQMLFTATEAIGFAYGVTWNTIRRNVFRWKHEEIGNIEAKVKSFCDIPHLLRLLRDFIVFAEKDEELQKVILMQHQTAAVDRVVARALDTGRTRSLVWHTQGSGKTYTMIKAAEMLFKSPQADKPTILLMIDRNELEDQMLKNLSAVGMGNVAHAYRIAELNRLLKVDYRGIIVTMIHKFRDMPANVNTRSNIYVLIDEAHRTTGGDLGNYLMAGLPNATFIGFTGTPVDKTAYGKGTFKTFGCEDDKGYLHKYSIAESIEDGTTLPLYYNLAPNDMLVPHELMEKEFFSLAETEGIADIEELNKILERAVNLKNFLKGRNRIPKVARHVAEHYRENVEGLGYKAFLVAVDREACAFYKEALDEILPPEYSEVVYTANNNDSLHAGVAYGRFDPHRLISGLTAVIDPKDEEIAIGLDLGSIHAAEALLLARYFMYTQVYFHDVRRVYDLHLKEFMQAWRQEGRFSPDWKNLLEITDHEVLVEVRKAVHDPKHPLHEHAARLQARQHFRTVYELVSTHKRKRPTILDDLIVATCDEFGNDNIRSDRYGPKSEPNDFLVQTEGGEIESSLQVSGVIANLPPVEIGFIFADRAICEKVRTWVKSKANELLMS